MARAFYWVQKHFQQTNVVPNTIVLTHMLSDLDVALPPNYTVTRMLAQLTIAPENTPADGWYGTYMGVYVDNADATTATISDPESDEAQWLLNDSVWLKVAAANTEMEHERIRLDVRAQRKVPSIHKRLWLVLKTDAANSAGVDMRINFRVLIRLP